MPIKHRPLMNWVSLCAGESAILYLLPELRIPMGGTLKFCALELKHNLHPDAMLVTRKGGLLCAVDRLHTLLAASMRLGHPITSFICRPLNPSKSGFMESSLSVSAFEADVSHHFSQAEITYHATLHGSRRGSLQHHANQGVSFEQLSQRAQIKTPAVLQRYLDPTRHLPARLPRDKPSNKRSHSEMSFPCNTPCVWSTLHLTLDRVNVRTRWNPPLQSLTIVPFCFQSFQPSLRRRCSSGS